MLFIGKVTDFLKAIINGASDRDHGILSLTGKHRTNVLGHALQDILGRITHDSVALIEALLYIKNCFCCKTTRSLNDRQWVA